MSKVFSFIKKPVSILSILFIITAGGFAYYFIKYNDVIKSPATISKQKAEEAKKKTDDLIKKISDLVLITDSTDAVSATITDKSKLNSEKFFDLAQNGDELILLPKMMKAVIYRPSANKIIDVGPFNPAAGEQASTTSKTSELKSATTTLKSTATSTVKR